MLQALLYQASPLPLWLSPREPVALPTCSDAFEDFPVVAPFSDFILYRRQGPLV